jgi:negative regulator of sigma-B (phosphoserine phosphatase)
MSYGISLKPFIGGRFSGDQGAVWEDDNSALICLVDGLGHGEGAEIAAKAAVKFVGENLGQDIGNLFTGCDSAISQTRGVAMALAWVDKTSQNLLYAAIGNTRAAIVGTSEEYLSGQNGIVGAGITEPVPEKFKLSRKQMLYMWSDGMTETLNFRQFRKWRGHDLNELASEITDEYSNANEDDGSLIIYRKM